MTILFDPSILVSTRLYVKQKKKNKKKTENIQKHDMEKS